MTLRNVNGYVAPALTVDALCLRAGRVLLIERKREPFAGRWALPGGFVEVGETVEQAVLRELREETGLTGDVRRLLGVYSDPARDPRGHTVAVVFLCEASGDPEAGDDAADARWWPVDALPPLAFDHARILADARAQGGDGPFAGPSANPVATLMPRAQDAALMSGVQTQYAPSSICFGCGPANAKGLRIQSKWEGDTFVARWRPEPHHQAFPGVLSGGIIGTLLDCHSNWCAATTLMREQALEAPPVTVTAEFAVKLRRPTPADAELELRAKPTKVEGDRVWVEAELLANGKVCDSGTALLVAVKEGHPAYHRWS